MDEEFDEEESEEGETEDGTPQVNEENVFYAGTRRSNN